MRHLLTSLGHQDQKIFYSDIELDFLNSFWNNTDFRKLKNRSYEFAVLTNNEMNITTKLLNWFEIESGEKLKSYDYNLIIHKYNVGDYFGYSLKIDPSGSKDLIVGDYKGSGTGSVYFFVSSSTGWNEVNYVNANQDFNYNLPYVNYPPSASYSQSFDGFGYSVSIYGDNAVVGCPYESQYYEYTSSQQLRYRGVVYFYYKCNLNNKWVLDTKSYGDDNTFKDNKLGYNVDIFDKYTTVSAPKYVFPFSSSFITASLNKVLTREDYERPFNLLGQV